MSPNSKPESLRVQMPQTAAFIDALREAFGAAGIDAAIRAGIRAEPNRFHAIENGIEVGVRMAGVEVDPILQWSPGAK